MTLRRSLAPIAALAALLVLAGCSGGGGDTEPSSAPSDVATSEAPTETSAAPVAQPTIPASCDAVGSPETRAATLDGMTLQSDGSEFVRPAPEGAELALGCDYIAGDATGYLLLVSTAGAEAASTAAEALPGEGYECGDDGAALRCDLVTPNSQFPVDTIETVYVRDGVWIYQSATNTDGATLLTDLVASIWA